MARENSRLIWAIMVVAMFGTTWRRRMAHGRRP
jgi:hypothetical protein